MEKEKRRGGGEREREEERVTDGLAGQVEKAVLQRTVAESEKQVIDC